MKKVFKKILSTILVLSMLTAATGCGTETVDNNDKETNQQSTGETVSSKDKTKIYFANYAVLENNYTEFWNSVKKGFEEKYPEYEIEYLTAGFNDMMTYVTNRVGGGDKVDLVFGEASWVPTLADAGITVPASDILSEDFINDFYPDILDVVKYDGEPYGIPMYFSNIVIYANKNLIEKAGLDVNNYPKTQEELMNWCAALSELKTDAGEKIFALGMPYAEKPAPGAFVNAMILAFGGQVLDDNSKLSIDNKGFDECVDFYVEMDKLGYNPQNTLPKDLRSLFANQSVAMTIDQTWGFSGIKSINPEAVDFTVSFPMPAMGTEGTGQTLTQAHTLMMANNGEKSAEGTRLLVEYIMDKDILGPYIKNVTPAFPSKKDMADCELDSVLDGAKSGSLNVKKQLNIPQTGTMQINLAKMINSICVGGKSPEEAKEAFRKETEIILNS